MKPSIGRAAAVATLCAAFLGSAPAAAQQHDRAAAEALFQAARELMDKGQYAAACKKFEASLRSDPALGTVLNLANCYDKVGRLASAWERFEEAAQKIPPGDERLAIARERAAALKARLPRLELTLDEQAPAGTRVLRDEILVDPGALGVAIPVDPGSHRIVVKAPGRNDTEVSIDAGEGKVVKRRLFAGTPAGSPPGVAPGPGPGSEPDRPSDGAPTLPPSGESWWSGRRVAGVVVGGVGVAGLAAGLGAGAVAMSKKSIVSQSCDTTTRTCKDQASIDAASAGKTASTASTVAFVLGVAAIGAGVTLLVIGAPDKATATRVGGVVLPGSGWVTVGRAF